MVNFLWDNIFQNKMGEGEIETALKNNYLFKILNSSDIKFLKDLVHRRVYKTGEKVFTQGELGIGMYIVVKGSVNITIEDTQTLENTQKNIFITRLTEGDFFGEISLVEQSGRRTATASAADEVVLLGFFKPDLNEVIERSPKMAIKILTRLSEILGRRLKETADRFSEVKRELKELSKDNEAN
jgi:CRP-like cAMP-binding protein